MVPAAQSGERLLNAWFRPQRVAVEEAANRQRVEQVRAFLNLSAAADRAADFGLFPEKFLPVCYITCIRTHTDKEMNMIETVKLTKIGEAVGIILPKELLARLDADNGDSLYVRYVQDGVQLCRRNKKFEAVMKAAREGMQKYDNTLRELAK